MPRKSGRPPKADADASKQQIIDATIKLIKEQGAQAVTVRNVCQVADVGTGTFYFHFQNKDDLLMYFLREIPFANCELKTPIENPADRTVELYMLLIDRYMELGSNFMKHFYSTDNKPLSAYLGEENGTFPEGTVMARNEADLLLAQRHGAIRSDANVHQICMDICTIVKGCVFEWCLTDGSMGLCTTLKRIITGYCLPHMPNRMPNVYRTRYKER